MQMLCHGMAVAVSARSPACLRCPSALSCIATAERRAASEGEGSAQVRQHLSLVREALLKHAAPATLVDPTPPVTASSRGVLRIKLTDQDRQFLSSLPQRVAGPTRNLMERGWFPYARRELRAGRNPVQKRGWKQVLCSSVLESQSRGQFEARLQRDLGLTSGSARAQCSFALSIFRAGKVIGISDEPLMVSTD
jgi:hypothetical protein